jgi:hypothetical protein
MKLLTLKSTFSLLAVALLLTANATAQTVTKESPLRPIFKGGYWGFMDAQGRIVIAPQYDSVDEFVGGLAQVGMIDEELPDLGGYPNLKLGYIDEKGRVVVPLKYAALHPFVGDLAAVAVRVDGPRVRPMRSLTDANLRWGYVDRQGAVVIPPQFLGAGDFAEGLAAVNVLPPAGVKGDGEGGMCDGPHNFGYIDRTGTIVIEPQYTQAGPFAGGRAVVGKGRYNYLGACLCCNPRFEGTFGFVDRSGAFTPLTTPAATEPSQ